MKKIYKVEDLDCAVCAQKLEDGTKKILGVKDASVNFMTQKLTIEFEESVNENDVMKNVIKTCKKILPDCTIKI